MDNYEVILRLGLAIFIGGLLGYERQYKNRPAGLRTHILVCVGAAIISMIQLHITTDTIALIIEHPELSNALKADMGRLGAQVISGIGFLGVGTIIREKGSVKGLTTAASIWTVGCIGLAIGMGYYFLSIISAVSVFFTVVLLRRFESNFFKKVNLVKLQIEYYNKEDLNLELTSYFKSKNIKIKDVQFLIHGREENTLFRKCLYIILVPRYVKIGKVIEELNSFEKIVKVIKE
ncbi:MgtC/SapB family protein [Clostridium ganghwense]|uniref:MgtC/SapB family protein n=1 Tax=Clostridium ganghwense TaxID=312089 RepID=A0ABT4CM23_9CLOT|nr:MgtC/SapB family protein [Clostridium ganghwense]MCY6370104.1 MgtC/SapB family protein [Clostridium ganghwense]